MTARSLALTLVVTSACGGAPARPLAAESLRGPAAGPSGRVLVISASCGSLETECRETWAPTVDQIVLGALEFRGYDTIDPASLRKDERVRDERIDESTEKTTVDAKSNDEGTAIIGIIPLGGSTQATHQSEVTIRRQRQRTVLLVGAQFDDLVLADKRAVMQLAGATTVATTRVIVGANYGSWNVVAQNVEVVVKLAAADTGDMRWSARCIASSADYSNVEIAIENAARCAASAFALNQ